MNPTENTAPSPDTEVVERELCRTCLEPNEPGATFCKDCGAPLSSYAATGPFETLLTEGHLYRQAAEHPQKLIVVLGMWVIFGFTAVAGVAAFSVNLPRSGSVGAEILGLGMFGISCAILWRTTRNYFRIRSEVKRMATAEC